MITAKEALQLSTAQLSADELKAVEKLEAEIDAHVKESMQHRGCEIKLSETNGNVIAETNQRLKRAGYQPQWQQVVDKHKLNAAIQVTVGYHLFLAPDDDAYAPSVN